MELYIAMGIKTKIHEHIKCGVESHIHRHICKHGHKHIHRAIRYINHLHHHLLHTGELIVIIALSFFSFMFAGSASLPNNTSFEYPLRKISTLECRTLYWNDMPDNCKINLPIIYGANYDKYKDAEGYKDFYTVLFGASYSDNWNQDVGAHDGVDIATARGTPLYSIGNGTIYFAGWKNGYGNVIKIKYLYKGEYVYAIYEHMDTIEVEQGQTVSKGQRVGTVGNSGNTFGLLGGYHLHLGIEKDAGGWPKYSYLNCPDLGKNTYEIVQKGLCREQMFQNAYDPIKFIEGNFSSPVLVDNTTNSNNEIINNVSPANVSVGTSVNTVNTTNVVNSTGESNPIVIPENNTINVVADKEIHKENLSLDISSLDQYSQHFRNQNEIWIESDLSGRNLKLGEEGAIIININKKNPTEKYNGVLTIPFTLMSTNTNVGLNLTSIKLVSDGKVEIKIKGVNVGNSSVLINFGGKKIAKVSLSVVN